MLYVAKVDGGSVFVADTDDNTVESVSRAELLRCLGLGITIQGATNRKGRLLLQEITQSDSAVEMAKRLLVDSIWKSAQLEGLGTTFPETEAILENLPLDGVSAGDVYFIINMKKAWKFVLDTLGYPLDIGYLQQLNKLVGDNLFYDCGGIRKIPVSIGGTNWQPDIPFRADIIDRILEIHDTSSSAEALAVDMFLYVARTQMFIDGNKRVAQLVANQVLISADIGIFQIPVELLSRFKGLLIQYYETGNDKSIKPFLLKHCIQRCFKPVKT